ncbi:MAG: glycosyltransferase [Chloroflexi bacterium]|nr:glycosyltransferase [Chloroflexota bacterium]
MKLAILTPQLPYPPQQGTTIRNFNIIKHLAPHHDITLICFSTTDELAAAEPLRAFCKRIEIAPYPSRSMIKRAWTTLTSPMPDMGLRLKSKAMHDLVERVMREEKFDVVQVEGIEMARYWNLDVRNWKLDNAPNQTIQPPTSNLQSPTSNFQFPIFIFDDHNAEYVLQKTAYESDACLPKRWHAALYSLIQWKKLERYEHSVCLRANHIVACSDTDANAIRALQAVGGQRSAVRIIPNGVDTGFFVPSDKVCAKPLADLSMVYAGKMDFRPNIDAMTWFCSDILPRIRAEIPLAHVVIVGQKPAPRIEALKQQLGVEVTGWVPDTRPYVADAAVYIVPLRMGSGTRLKVLEAMAMGKAIVSTSRGVEGIELVPGRDALIADTPAEFARTVIDLLHDPVRCRELGRNARDLVVNKYDWRTIIPQFESLYR